MQLVFIRRQDADNAPMWSLFSFGMCLELYDLT